MKADEKKCPKCAETIKKAAVKCKHCGYEFTPEEIEEQKKVDAKTARTGCLVAIGLVLLVSTCTALVSKNDSGTSTSSSSDSKAANTKTSEPSQEDMMIRYEVAAKQAMKDSLKDPGSAKYKDVTAHALKDKPGAYVFCGLVNSKNGFGGYTGFQRFVAGPGIAVTEEIVSDFPVLWNQLCVGPGTPVWF